MPTHYTRNDFPAQMPFQYAASRIDNTPVDNPVTDAGATQGRVLFYLAETTGNPLDSGRFKSPFLRNIAVTAPYMHDGRFATLEQVSEHYNSGIQRHPNLQPPLLGSDGQVNNFNFSEEEKAASLAFMHTLTEEAMLSDVKFSNPFR